MERMRVSSPRIDGARRLRAVVPALAIIATMAVAQPGIARGQAPQAGQGSLARYVPKQDKLFFYLEFDGLDAHQAAWKNSAAYKLLNDTKLGALLEDLAGQGIELAQQSARPDRRIKPAELIGLFKLAAKQGFAAGFWGENPGVGGFVIVARGGDRPEVIRLVKWSIRPSRRRPRPEGRPNAPSADISARRPRSGDPVPPPPTDETAWWVEKGDLVLSSKPDLVISVLDGQSPNVVDHPVRTALLRKSDGFEPIAAGFFDVTAMPPMPPQAVQLGLDGLKRVEIQWGIQDDALLAVVGLVAPQPRRGVLAMLDQPTFNIRSLPPLPAGLTGFVVLSLDPGKIYDQIVELAKQTNPRGGEGFARLEEAVRQRFGFDLRKDVLAQLGPKIALYSQAPAAAGGQSGHGDAGPVHRADDRGAGPRRGPRAEPRQARRGDQPDHPVAAGRRPSRPARSQRRRHRAPQAGCEAAHLRARPARGRHCRRRSWRCSGRRSSWARASSSSPPPPTPPIGPPSSPILPADRLWKPTGAFVPMARRLPGDLVFLSVSDPRETLPEAIEGLPMIVAQMNLMFPAVSSAREAARRAQCTNNMKQIALALLNYFNVHNHSPRAGDHGQGRQAAPELAGGHPALPRTAAAL